MELGRAGLLLEVGEGERVVADRLVVVVVVVVVTRAAKVVGGVQRNLAGLGDDDVAVRFELVEDGFAVVPAAFERAEGLGRLVADDGVLLGPAEALGEEGERGSTLRGRG